MRRILYLAASTENIDQHRLSQEVRDIRNGLKIARLREKFSFNEYWSVNNRALQRALLEVQPTIIHFSGHRKDREGVYLEDREGKPKIIDGSALASLFDLVGNKGLECVLLNGCYSDKQAQEIAVYVPYVLGTTNQVNDRVAIEFAVAFYDALGNGNSIEFAFQFGKRAMDMEHAGSSIHCFLERKSDPTEGSLMIGSITETQQTASVDAAIKATTVVSQSSQLSPAESRNESSDKPTGNFYNPEQKQKKKKTVNPRYETDIHRIWDILQVSTDIEKGYEHTKEHLPKIKAVVDITKKLSTIASTQTESRRASTNTFLYGGTKLENFFTIKFASQKERHSELLTAIKVFEDCHLSLFNINREAYRDKKLLKELKKLSKQYSGIRKITSNNLFYELATTAVLISACAHFADLNDKAIEWIDRAETQIITETQQQFKYSKTSSKIAQGGAGLGWGAFMGIGNLGGPVGAVIGTALYGGLVLYTTYEDRKDELSSFTYEITKLNEELNIIREIRARIYSK